VTVRGATTNVGRLVERYGAPVPGLEPLGLGRLFPLPEQLAEASLDGLGLTRARAHAIRAFARAVAQDSIRLDRSVGLERLVESILAVEGLGPWTAHYLALRLGERDACPVTDLGLSRALARVAPAEEADVARVAERWRPWRALGATHLWLADGALAR
jgi:AraC family transcriptional regulator of adaptative response / DNA-3-methyladenine glycosylase II